MAERAEPVKTQCTDCCPSGHTHREGRSGARRANFLPARSGRLLGGARVRTVILAVLLGLIPPTSARGQTPDPIGAVQIGDQDGLALRVTPISGALGLADVAVELTRSDARPVLVLRPDGDRDAPLFVGMLAVDGQPQSFTMRVRTGGPLLRFGVRIEEKAPPHALLAEHGPFERSTAPDSDLATPDWAKGCVWYQIFPERFRNGNPDNDPAGQSFFRKPWTSRWSDVCVDELESAWARSRARPFARAMPRGRPRGQLYNVIYDRRYGGDLQGIVEKLDELRDLGVEALYLNPIFHAQSLHKYDASDYRHIDPTLAHPGTPSRAELDNRLGESIDPATWVWTEADRYFVDVLLVEARKRGMRVVIDGVWNHVGMDFWAFRDVMEHGSASPFAHWFEARFADPKSYPDWLADPSDLRPGTLVGWKSWGGGGRNGGLPELARDPKRAHQRLLPEIEEHIWAVTRRWMDPNGDGDPSDGIDGWRLDVVPDMPTPFWQAWRNHVKSINPDAVLHCEVWFDAKDYFEARAFDGQMNYPFAMPLVRWLSGEQGTPSERLVASLDRAFRHAPQHDLVQMNLLMSHDTDRLVSRLTNPGLEYDQGARMSDRSSRYDDGRPDERVYDLSVLACAIQATYLGAPMIYNGDEFGMYGADDPDCRKPMSWPDLGTFEEADESGRPDVRDRYRAWLRLRRDPQIGEVLRYGSVRLVPSGHPDVLVFDRTLNGRSVRVVANRSDYPIDVDHLRLTSAGVDGSPVPVESPRRIDSVKADENGVIQARSARVWARQVSPSGFSR